jgi:hypothetical protein
LVKELCLVKLRGVEERRCDRRYENEVHGEDEDHAHEAIHDSLSYRTIDKMTLTDLIVLLKVKVGFGQYRE